MSDLAARIAALPPEKRALLLRKLEQKRQAERRRIQPQPRQGQSFPLSFEQERMWFIHQWDPTSPLYNSLLALCLSGQLDLGILERALDLLLQRHESLRTGFRMENLRPVQVIAPALDLPLTVADVAQSEFYRRANAEIRRPFDLETPPLWRATLFRLSETESVLVLVVHHIIHDGWSLGVLARELAAAYGALSAGRPPALPELPFQYADFAVWQRGWLQGDELDALLGYWQEQLAGAPDVLDLPSDRPRPAVQTSRGDRLPLKLGRSLCDRVKAFSRERGATPFMTLLAAFAALLHRLTGQQDLVLGTPVANRGRPELEGLVGLFMNTLALRVDLTGDPTFEQLLERVRRVTLDAQAHQALPFARLVSALQPERSLSHTPLFQVSFGFQEAPLQAEIPLPDLTMELLEVRSLSQQAQLPSLHNGMSMFDLTVYLVDAHQEIGGWIEYRTELFERAAVARLADHYQILLRAALVEPDRPVSALPVLSKDEKRRMVAEWNQTQAPYPDQACFHHLFAAQAARTPDAPAVTFEGQSLTYAQLERRANQLAHHLRARGVGPETLVGVCVERSLPMIVAILGVMKAGGAYLPLDPAYPQERLAFMLADARPALVLTQERLASGLPVGQVPLLRLDADWPTIAQGSESPPKSGATPDNLAYVIYTSGSTGRPKGVLVPHRGLCNVSQAQVQTFDVRPGDRVAQFSSLNFDASIFEIVMALRSGAALCLGTADTLAPGPPLGQFLRDRAITHLTIPPSSLAAVPPRPLPELRVVAVAGEACPADLVERWGQGRRFFNLYGPTETSIWATATECEAGVGSPPIGRPIPNLQVYVLDPKLRPVPVGVPGELVVGGVGVARGYLDRSGLTAERFVPDPFGGEPGARLYRTGDRVRYRPDGTLEFLGRLDHQVKLRGFRIELGEIEAVLAQHPAVGEALVLLRGDDGRQRLVVYHRLSEGAEPPARELRAFLGKQLPDYMIPAAFVPLETWPLTPNGKVDRGALPDPAEACLGRSETYVAPRDWTEETLTAIWAELLRVERVGVHDNFFELGGDSILSIQMATRAGQAGLTLTPRQVFQHQTVAELAQVAGTAPKVRAEQGVVSGPVPLTPIQRWFFEHQLPRPAHWNQAVMVELPERLEPAGLKEALSALLAHHDGLRLRYRQTSDGWQQVNAAPGDPAPFESVDLGPVPPDEQPARLEAKVAEAQASLDLVGGPLTRLIYVDLGEGEPARLFWTVHHLAVDGVSWRILIHDLLTAYHQLVEGGPVSLPAKTTSFKAWAERLGQYAQSAEVAAQADYWLDPARQQVAPLPRDGDGPNLEGDTQIVSLNLGRDETQFLLHQVPASGRARVDEALIAPLVQTLVEWSGESKWLLDLEGHGREPLFEDVDLSCTVGWFTTLFPVLLDMGSAQRPETRLERVVAQLRAVPGRGLGYGLLRYLREDPQLAPRLAGLPQAQVNFNYLGQFLMGDLALAPESVEPLRDPCAPRRYLIEVDAQIVAERLRVDWVYSPAVHEPETAEGLAARYRESLLALIRSLGQETGVGG